MSKWLRKPLNITKEKKEKENLKYKAGYIWHFYTAKEDIRLPRERVQNKKKTYKNKAMKNHRGKRGN